MQNRVGCPRDHTPRYRIGYFWTLLGFSIDLKTDRQGIRPTLGINSLTLHPVLFTCIHELYTLFIKGENG